MKQHFLGMAAEYKWRDVMRHTFAVGMEKDCCELRQYLRERYEGRAILCKNGRSALCIALKTYFKPGEAVLVNGFTCYAVYEAVKAAGLVPVFADINKKDLNYSIETLKDASSKVKPVGIIVQNSLGNPVDIVAIEKFAKENDLMIIEDLAHCVGVHYKDGRECGTVGVAAAFSFGKDKVIDAISGGAVVLRPPYKRVIKAPDLTPKASEHMRARFYPLFGALCRGLTHIHLGGVLMRGLVKIHWVEKSADNELDIDRKISKFEAKSALRQFKSLKKSGPIRDFYLVENREEVLKKLAHKGYHFDGLWYKQPVSPERYYKKIKFPEDRCKEAVFIADHIINLPTYYDKEELKEALKIIEPYLIKGGKNG